MYIHFVDKITLSGIRFYGYHGTHAFEKKYGQEFFVDAEIITDLSASGKSDKLKDTVNYVEAYKKIVNIGTKKKFNLIETLAENIARELLKYKKVGAVRVRVTKPKGVIGGPIESTSVQIERNKKKATGYRV